MTGTVLTYSGGWLDRVSARRSDPRWIEGLLAAPGTRLLTLGQDQCLVSGSPPEPVTRPVGDTAAVLAAASAASTRSTATCSTRG
jgi:hypothetical protein